MAARTRINTKFILIASISLATVGALVGGTIYLQWKGNAARQAAQGDELMEQGDPVGASRYYSRAVRRDPGNLEYLRTYETTLRAIRPETGDAARTYYGQLLAAMRQEAIYNAADPASHLKLLEELHNNARVMTLLAPAGARRSHWEQIVNSASDMLLRVPSTDPAYEYGKLYRGLANSQLHATVGDSALDQADEDLQAFVDANPENDFGWAMLAQCRYLIAEHAKTASGSRRAAELLAKVAPTMQQAIEAVPNGPMTNLVHTRYLASQMRDGVDGVTEQQVRAAALRSIELIEQSNDPWLVLEASQLASMAGRNGERNAAIDLLQAFVQDNPDVIIHRFLLAQLYFRTGRNAEAADIAEQVVESQPLPVSFTSQMQLTMRRLAAGLLVDVEHRLFAEAESNGLDPDIEPVRQARQRLATFVVDVENDSQLIRADAKLAMLEGDYDAAAGGFERLIREGTADVETYAMSALALEQIGQVGLAHSRIVEALQLRERMPFLLLRKARLEYQMGRFDEASGSIAMYLELAPDDQQAGQFARAIEAARSGESLSLDDPVALALQDAQQAMEEGQTDTARATIDAALAESDDLRLLNAAARLAMGAGQMDVAMQYVQRALQLQPESRHFRQLRAMLETGDPVSAAEQFMQAEFTDEAERAVMLLIAYSAIASEHRQATEVHENSGKQELAEQSRDIAQRAEAAESRQLATAIEKAPEHPQLIEYRFTKALNDRNWSEAETLANQARDVNADRARGLIYRGRYAYQRERFDEAVRAFQQASELIPYSSLPWRGLAMSYQRIGNLREAQRAYDQAYQANPNDMRTVRSYLALLMQTGDQTRATRVAQTAYRLRPNDDQLREAWLELETQQGNIETVLPLRREIYAEQPENRENAIRLAVLLSRTNPTVGSLLDGEGARVYSDRRWNQLSPIEQRRILAEKKTQWQQEADEIVAAIETRDGQDVALVSVKAMLRRMQGDVAGGEQVLRQYIDSRDESEQEVRAHLALGQYLEESGKFNEAYAAFTRALEYQDEQQREADRAIGNFLFNRGVYEGAIHHFEQVLQVAPEYNIQLRVVDALINLSRFEQAEQRLNSAWEVHAVDVVGAMLQAMALHGQGVELASRGQDAEAESKFAAHRQALETAERLNPTSPAPYALRARLLMKDAQRTGQRSLLNDALNTLGRADSLRPNDPQTSLVRIEVLRAMNNTTSAVAEASRLVNSAPDNIQYRRLLVQIHLDAGNHSAATNVIRQAIERYPTMFIWHELLGNVHARAGEARQATAAFQRAFELERSAANLARYVGVLLSMQDPDYNGLLTLLGPVPEQVNDHPGLAAAVAIALHNTNQQDRSRQYLNLSYGKQRELISNGSMPESEIGRWFQTVGPILASMPPRDAEQLVMQLCNQNPDPYELMWIGRFWASAGEEGTSRASELLGQAVDKTSPDDLELRLRLQFELANLHLFAERYDAAAVGYERALQIEPDHAPSLNNVAFIKANYLDDAAGALPHAQRALELNPQDPSVLDTVGWVHFKLGNYTQAEDFLRRSLAINPTAATQMHLAHVFVARGEYDNALTRLQRAAELRPDSRTQAEIDRLADDIRTKRTQAR